MFPVKEGKQAVLLYVFFVKYVNFTNQRNIVPPIVHQSEFWMLPSVFIVTSDI